MEPAPAGRNAEAEPGRPLRAVLAGPQVYERMFDVDDWRSRGVRLAPDCVGAPPLQCASVAGEHIAALTGQGEVLCTERPREGLFPVCLPWPAAAVSCGICYKGSECFAVALRRGGGSVRQWRLGVRETDGVVETPKEVSGLPTDDPVVAVQAGVGITVALTARGRAYGWGDDSYFTRFGPSDRAAVRLTELSGHRIRRITCGNGNIWAESREGELLYLSPMHPPYDKPPVSMKIAKMAFPLRDMAASDVGVNVIDAVGDIWWIQEPARQGVLESDESDESDEFSSDGPRPFPGPAHEVRPQRAKCVASAFGDSTIALAEDGELWEDEPVPWKSISAGRPELRGMLPYGAPYTDRILLLPDTSCGKSRLRLFARIAVRLQLPCDPLRVALVRAAVQGCYIVGHEHDPFRWPVPTAPVAAAAAAAAAAGGH